MKKVAFHNLGCKVNAYEMELMQQKFSENGYEIVPFTEKADIYIINTCTVTNIADRKSRQMLHRAKALSPDAIVVAAGCYVETDREGALADDAIDILVSNKEKADIVRIVEAYETGDGSSSHFASGHPIVSALNQSETRNRPLFHTRAFIKIQDGCDQYCSYCIIPMARGHVVSRPEEETLKEIGDLAAA
ncbi:MAG: tRNA (N(6)-L-threonylcarbamoyladenosine(37)-C(2))-methylthiotransferase MtaB, partial [Lachnospiraceae bacterium]|nr:tRNA (N(6)-L-threonylcarbamoyladenosine(37)-C(2))-methylthiotransferase MtaB [Lachnospiraceae bacterium]